MTDKSNDGLSAVVLRRNSNDVSSAQSGSVKKASREASSSSTLSSIGRIKSADEKGYLNTSGGLMGKEKVELAGTPADFIFQTLLGEFKEQSKRKIEETMAYAADKKLLLAHFFDSSEDPVFGQLLEAMGRLSQNAVPVLIRSLLNWRSNQHVVDSTLKSLLQNTTNAKLSQRDGMALLEERHSLAIDFIFCTTLLSLFKSGSVDNLDEAICSQLEAIAFEHFRPREKQNRGMDSEFIEALEENRKEIPKLYAQILGILSPYRLTHIAALLFKEVGVLAQKGATVTKTKIATIEGMRYLQLHIDTKAGVEQALGFLARYFDMFKHKSSDLKLTLSQTVVSICQPLLQQPLAKDVDYSEWHKAAASRFQLYSKKIKTRSVKTWYPFLTILLCMSDKEFFQNNFHTFTLEALIKLLKDRAHRATALECIYLIIGTYLHKYNDADATKKLQTITSHVFSTKEKLHSDSVQIGTYVDIITTIAEKKLDYAVKTIIFDLLRVETQPDRVIIGVKALIRVISKERSKTNEPPDVIPASLAPYMPNINDFFSTILVTLDKQYCGLVMPFVSKQNQELLQKEKLGIKLLRSVFSCMPMCLPTKLSTSKFLDILARYLIHLDQELREQVNHVFVRLMEQCPNLRSDVIHAVANVPLGLLPDTSYKVLLHVVLGKFSSLLHLWSHKFKNDDDMNEDEDIIIPAVVAENNRSSLKAGDPKMEVAPVYRSEMQSELDFNPSLIEAVALVLLCSPIPPVRIIAIEILGSVRLIASCLLQQKHAALVAATLASGGDPDQLFEEIPPPRVMDIIDETGPDIIQRFNQDFRIRMLQPSLPMYKVQALQQLYSAELPDYQIAWTYCLGGLLPLTLDMCPEAVNAAWKMVYARARTIKNDEKSSGTLTRDQELYWWSNYILFICAAVSDSVLEPENKRLPSSVPEIFKELLPLLKVERDSSSVVMALQRCNPKAYDQMFEALRPVEQEYSKKKRKGNDELRNQISFIYSHVAESMKPGTLVENENLRQFFLAWISETMKYLTHPTTECVLDNHRSLRLNFCDIVANVARDLHTSEKTDLFALTGRKKLFHFLLNWCRTNILEDETNKRAIVANLSQVRDLSKKGAYESLVTEQVSVLQQMACAAAAALLLGPVFDEDAISDQGPVFRWINSILEGPYPPELGKRAVKKKDKLHAIGRTALEGFLQNTQYPKLLENTINQCYSPRSNIAKGYFLALVELYKMQTVNHPLPVIFNLILLKAGDPMPVMRRNAITLLQLIAPQTVEENLTYSPLSVTSGLDVTYRRSQYELSQRLAKQNPKLVAPMVAEMVHRLEGCTGSEQKQILTTIIPWIQEMNSHLYKEDSFLSDSEVEDLLQNFLVITLLYADSHPIHVQKIWTTLAAEDNSIATVINFLLNFGVKKKSALFIPLAKKVITFFGRAASQVTVDTLVNELSSLESAPTKKDDRPAKILSSGTVRAHQGSGSLSATSGTLTNLSSLMPETRDYSAPARGHLALIFLAELAFEIKDEFLGHLPVILHQVFLGLDAANSLVCDHSRVLLLNLIHSLVVERLQSESEIPENCSGYEDALDLEEHFLKAHENKQLWAAEDITIRRIELQSTKELDNLVKRVVAIFATEEKLRDEWSTESLKWAISCPSSHLAARSYQVYRALLPCVTKGITPVHVLDCMFSRCRTRTGDNLSVSLEILITLQAMVDTLDSAKFWLFREIFWAAVALLHSDYEQEYLQAVKVLSKLVTRFNFSDLAVQNVFLSVMPKAWEPPFTGLQSLVMRGLLSESTYEPCTDLIIKFTLMPCPQLFFPEPKRLLANILGLLPWLSLHITEQDPTHKCWTAFSNLAEASSATYPKLAKVFQNCKKRHYPSMDAFFADLYKPFASAFFPEYINYTFRFLFSLLECHTSTTSSSQGWPPPSGKVVLQLVKYLFSEVQLGAIKKQKLVRSWLSCISRFVVEVKPTWKDALEVLGQVVKQSNLSVSHMITTSFRPLQLTPQYTPFPNMPGQGDERALRALREVLKATEHSREKANVISDDFWKIFFNTETAGTVDESGDDVLGDNRSPRSTYTSNQEVESEDENSNGDFYELQDIFSAFSPGGFPYSSRGTDLSEMDRINDFLEALPSESSRAGGAVGVSGNGMGVGGMGVSGGMGVGGRGAAGDLNGSVINSGGHGHHRRNESREKASSPRGLKGETKDKGDKDNMLSSGDGDDFMDGDSSMGSEDSLSPSAWTRHRWRKLSEKRRFNSEAEMFEIFPVAGQLLNLLLADYRSQLSVWSGQVPPGIVKNVLSSTVLKVEVVDLPLFQQQIPEPKQKKVLFSIACSKYRSLAEDSKFLRAFTDKRIQVVDAFNRQQRIYFEQKDNVDHMRSRLLKEGEKESVEFGRAILSLHRHLLLLYQINASLQALVNFILDSSPTVQPLSTNEMDAEEEKQRTLLEKELEKNRQLEEVLGGGGGAITGNSSISSSGGGGGDTEKGGGGGGGEKEKEKESSSTSEKGGGHHYHLRRKSHKHKSIDK
eukprot:TRINITY_DN2269_c1_g1_i10.p1 TRINITY_DN2269_c1_g1~~TRINITY_DN2269_c1_g1_i10.p1  ORF type:complete len:2503 (-),score=428.99 TRINITY_DN2269_c1_g1_i10:100-7608(-)